MNANQKVSVLEKLQLAMANELAKYGHPSQTKQRIEVMTAFKKISDAISAA